MNTKSTQFKWINDKLFEQSIKPKNWRAKRAYVQNNFDILKCMSLLYVVNTSRRANAISRQKSTTKKLNQNAKSRMRGKKKGR